MLDIAAPSASGTLEDRFDSIGWGLLAILVGVMALPSGTPTYVLAAVTGGAMLGINVARRLIGVPVRWFSVVLGAVVLAAGVAAMAGTKFDLFAAFFVALGLVVIAGAIIGRH